VAPDVRSSAIQPPSATTTPLLRERKMARKNEAEFWLVTIVLVVILIGILVVLGRLAL
jgi:hypothetical protein